MSASRVFAAAVVFANLWLAGVSTVRHWDPTLGARGLFYRFESINQSGNMASTTRFIVYRLKYDFLPLPERFAISWPVSLGSSSDDYGQYGYDDIGNW